MILLFLLSFLSFSLSAQDSTATVHFYRTNSIKGQFKYIKKDIKGVVYHCLINGVDTVRVASQIKSKSNAVRKAVAGGKSFQFRYDDIKKQDQILGEGKVLATTKSFYDVTTAEGAFYDNIKIDSREWKYIYNGKEVVKGKFVKTNSSKIIELIWMDNSIPDLELLHMMCMVYGVNLVQASAKKPYIYMGIVAAAVLSAAISSDPTPPTN